ncbi:phospholipase D-like domain-containing protein [Paracoccus sp. SCSIO 75233]|uniref:phospholipase D-like domain-containing protein n=1 Tax=Paracoccus sp. SCSIO 75233 TaxID=3017782 RepID=UPI0022F12105|nr:phospholipase D-like domain-containing protein [Paracoccus sp. SCSIO 75233]WBU51855.1 phospholipase D-like domain-containing protein [Paracoccus sp. SCSIO 75233]
MRVRNEADDLTAQAVSGSHVVLLGWSWPREKCDGLAGFAIHKTDLDSGAHDFLPGMKTFAATDPGLPPGALHSTRDHPIQSFMWSDYGATPGGNYRYRIIPLKGEADALTEAGEVGFDISTEAPEGGLNDVHFNRGIAGSQQYARLFGNRKPSARDRNDPAWGWLSRGLFEAMCDFVNAAGPGDRLRVCAYEFHFLPFLRVLRQAVDRGVDLRVIYDAKDKPDSDGVVFPRDANRAAAAEAGIAEFCIERQSMKSAISHNKFIIRYRGDTPVSVWTGGTNFSEGGIYGQSNVGEVAEHDDLAAKYAAFWDMLADDPMAAEIRDRIDALTPTPDGQPPEGTSCIFSPRGSLDVLEWYAERAMQAQDALFMTFAFGMHDLFKEVYRNGNAPLRFALMERATRTFRTKEEREAEERRIRLLRFQEENLFGIGSHLRKDRLGTWLAERLTGLNSHVRYVHNKFMLIDPLSDDPLIVAGSANFSAASTTKNDENMLLIRGNTRVADIYLGEYMRLYNHHAFRDFLNRRGNAATLRLNHLREDDWWTKHFDDVDMSRRRCYFSGRPYEK